MGHSSTNLSDKYEILSTYYFFLISFCFLMEAYLFRVGNSKKISFLKLDVVYSRDTLNFFFYCNISDVELDGLRCMIRIFFFILFFSSIWQLIYVTFVQAQMYASECCLWNDRLFFCSASQCFHEDIVLISGCTYICINNIFFLIFNYIYVSLFKKKYFNVIFFQLGIYAHDTSISYWLNSKPERFEKTY